MAFQTYSMQTETSFSEPTGSPVPSGLAAATQKSLWWFAYDVKQFFYQLLRVDVIRLFVAAVRYVVLVFVLRRMRTMEPQTGDIGVNTVYHNMSGLKTFHWLGVNRSSLLLYPLSAIRVSKSAPLLTIGPRSEGEILNLLGLGYRNIRGLDLISYSPWVDLGDMHAMPYQDNQFQIVVMGWVIAYSDNRRKAAEEVIRVTRNGGIVAVGVEFSRQTTEELSSLLGYEVPDQNRLQSVAEILALFAPYVDHVYFSQDLSPIPHKKWQLLVIFSVKK